jgi:hypothetical protein
MKLGSPVLPTVLSDPLFERRAGRFFAPPGPALALGVLIRALDAFT